MIGMSETAEMVMVERAELERLRKIEADQPALIESIRKETAKERFKEMQSSDTPEKVRQRANKYYQLHKEEIAARRKEKKQKQEAGTAQ
jgi:hypothetical protein